jgi:hypothetical protein
VPQVVVAGWVMVDGGRGSMCCQKWRESTRTRRKRRDDDTRVEVTKKNNRGNHLLHHNIGAFTALSLQSSSSFLLPTTLRKMAALNRATKANYIVHDRVQAETTGRCC